MLPSACGSLADRDLNQPRGVGRKQLPTSTGGALIHVATHILSATQDRS